MNIRITPTASASRHSIAGRPRLDSVYAVPVLRTVVPSYAEAVTDRDAVLTRSYSDKKVTDYEVIPLGRAPKRLRLALMVDNDRGRPVRGSRVVRHVSDGACRIQATHEAEFAHCEVTFATQIPAYEDTLLNYVPGTLGAHIADAISQKLAGRNAANAMAMFTSLNDAAGTYVKNPNFWLQDMDLSFLNVLTRGGLTPSNTYTDFAGGTLISPIHVHGAKHWLLKVNARVRFMRLDGTWVDRTIVAVQSDAATDHAVGKLDSEVPAGINFARVLPARWTSKIAEFAENRPIPSINITQFREAVVQDIHTLRQDQVFGWVQSPPPGSLAYPFYKPAVMYDSGNPVFVLINGQPVYLFGWMYANGGPFISSSRAAVNAMMASLGGGYQLTDADLSGFPGF